MGPKPNRTFPAGSPAAVLCRRAAQLQFNREGGDGDGVQIWHYTVLCHFFFITCAVGQTAPVLPVEEGVLGGPNTS